MAVKWVEDPRAFLELVSPLLLADEARHNLMLGVAGTLRDEPDVYRSHELVVAERGGAPVAAGLRTPPFNLLVAGSDDRGVTELAEALRETGVELPGVTGAVPEGNVFAARWVELTGATARPKVRQRIYGLSRLVPPRPTPGAARTVTAADRDLLVAWVAAFGDELGHGLTRAVEETVDARLAGGGFMLWELEEPVSVASWGTPTPNGIRIGPVYTPPEHRGRGYASAVTAAASATQLSAGRRFCFLYTDVENPTSNKIYRDLGYEPVCDSVEYVFVGR